MTRILIVDGMGGGMGKQLVQALRGRFPDAELVACGTNSSATEAMLKSGADIGATGENAICYQASRCTLICGSFGIVVPHAMQGELSPRMAEAVTSADVPKFLLPIHKCQISLAAPQANPSESLAILLDQVENFLGGTGI